MARVRGGEAIVLELHPFFRRAAFAAAALFLAATAAALWQGTHGDPSRSEVRGEVSWGPHAGIPRDEMLAEIVQRGFGSGR